ncbi:MAG: FprA family A-type flavoprotein [Bacteroidales bacterium]|jgi:flavorubredoxin|nr:FprA family A-type flavoprotein [Bacteroidales bacterium]
MAEQKNIQITPDVYWVGVLDKDIVTFDVVMETEHGTSYNSYFIDAEKKTIIETVKERFWDTYIEKIKSVVDPAEIEYIIVNHTEPDHSGNLRNLLNLAPKATVIGSTNAIRYLKDLMGADFPHKIVKDGQTLDLGNKTLRFIGAPNLHWPDSIYTYLEEDHLLFSCDSFGSHFADDRMWDDEVGDFDKDFKYYFDVILKPFSKFMLKAIEKIKPLRIKAILPGHGPLLRKNWQKYVQLSEVYSNEFLAQPERKYVFIPYVSAYHKTGLIAEAIAEGIQESGEVDAILLDVEKSPIGELDMQMEKASGIIVGSPTINQNILLPIYKLFAIINPLRDKGKLSGAFGSYGWSGEGSKLIENNLRNLKLDFFTVGMFFKFTPNQEELEKCRSYGRDFAAKIADAD